MSEYLLHQPTHPLSNDISVNVNFYLTPFVVICSIPSIVTGCVHIHDAISSETSKKDSNIEFKIDGKHMGT